MTLVLSLFLLACAPEPRMGMTATCGRDPMLPSHTECPDGATIDGIDVSYWQGSIDWDRVADDGVKFAFIRVSHGMETYDTRYTENWQGARDAGITRGTYQYFMAGDSAVDQANLLLDEMGPLEDGDLPPVLDVENGDNEGISVSTMKDAIQTWIDIVEPAIGRPPLIYTSISSWSSMTGDWEIGGDIPLWVANWGVSCPSVPDPWDDWVFWQHDNEGSISGISGDVDLDVFNGNEFDLAAWASPPVVEPCDTACMVSATDDTVVEEDAACACTTGDLAHFAEADGHDGHSWWLRVDVSGDEPGDGVTWTLDFRQAGSYEVSAYVPEQGSLTGGAIYEVYHGGVTTHATIDQASGPDDWVSLGTFDFTAGGDQWVQIGDNYTNADWAGKRVALDAIRITPPGPGPDTGDTDDTEETGGTHPDCPCETGDNALMTCTDGGTRTRTCEDCAWSDWSPCSGADRMATGTCACGTGRPGTAGFGLLGVLLGLVRRRRRMTDPAQTSP